MLFYCLITLFTSIAEKKDLNRREGKGFRCCLVNRLASFPCRAGYIAPGRYEEFDELILLFKSSWCKSSFFSNRLDANHPILQIVLVENSYSAAIAFSV